jgi:hypothetical protein
MERVRLSDLFAADMDKGRTYILLRRCGVSARDALKAALAALPLEADLPAALKVAA